MVNNMGEDFSSNKEMMRKRKVNGKMVIERDGLNEEEEEEGKIIR